MIISFWHFPELANKAGSVAVITTLYATAVRGNLYQAAAFAYMATAIYKDIVFVSHFHKKLLAGRLVVWIVFVFLNSDSRI